MVINRVYGYPNKWTFQIPPIRDLISRYIGTGKGWIDPFSGNSSLVEFTNDLNPNMPAKYHYDALVFLKQLQGNYEGALFDPPYSSTQVKVCYDSIGYIPPSPKDDFLLAFDKVKNELANLIKSDGYCISFGWNSTGLGKKRGFVKLEVFLVNHGGHHNDTIVTVERKQQSKFL